MSLAVIPEALSDTPMVGRLATEIVRRFSKPDANYDGERLILLEQIIDFAANAEREILEQREKIAELEQLTRTDELTGLTNRRGLEGALESLLASACRHQEKGVICYIDIDDFKGINDSYGHAAGDRVLQKVAEIISDNVRLEDIVARVGGDEFVVVLTRTNLSDGLRKAKALQRTLDEAQVQAGRRSIGIKVSLGIQSYDGRTSVIEIMTRADHAMYADKRARKLNLVPIGV